MFDPIRIYDKPAVILTQLGNGIATTDSVRRALFDPAALSPRERQSYAEGLKKSTGGNPIVDTALDVLANPLSWLAFVAGGAMATKNFAKSGRFFMGGIQHAGYGEWAKSKWPFLRSIRALSASQELSGTPIPALLEMMPGEMRRTQNEFSGYVTPGLSKVLRFLSQKHGVGVNSLDPASAPNAAVEHDLEIIGKAVNSKLSGWDKETTYKYVTGLKPRRYEILTTWEDSKGKLRKEWIDVGSQKEFDAFEDAVAKNKNNALFVADEKGIYDLKDMKFLNRTEHDSTASEHRHSGRIRSFQVVDPDTKVRGDSVLHSGIDVEYVETNRGAMIGDVARLERDIREFGLQELIDGADRMRQAIRARLYGNEDLFKRTGRFEIDRNKILRIARGAMNELENQGVIGKDGRLNYEQAATANSILTEEVAGAIIDYGNKNRGAGMTAKEIEQLVVDSYSNLVDDPYYLPRNTTAVYKNTGSGRVEVEPSAFSRPGSFLEGFGREITPSGRTKFRTRDTIPIDPEDIQFIIDRYGETPEIKQSLIRSRNHVQNQQRMDVRGLYKVHRIAPDIALQKYIVSSARDAILFSDNPFSNLGIVAALKDFPNPRTNVRYPGPTGGAGIPAHWRPYGGGLKPAGGFSLNDLIETQMRSLEEQSGADGYVARSMRQHVLPSIFGYRTVEDGASRAMGEWLRGKALSIANSQFFKAVEAYGGIAERFVRGMRRYGSSPPMDSSGFGSDIARIFYGSTIGLNLNTAFTNLLQPLHNLHQLGFRNTVKAYAQSIEMMYAYGKARIALGKGASPQQIEEAMDRTMNRTLAGGVKVSMRDIADISTAWDSVEKAGYGAQISSSRGGVFEAVMKPFQLTEMVNRLATGNAVLNAAESGWKMAGRNNKLDPYRAIQESRLAVETMQFGSSPLNRPLMFYTDYLRNPAIRQFLQFPVRSAVNIATMPGLVGGTRNVLGAEVSSPFGIAALDTMRMMGVSAIAYEVGKNMLGADLSRGLSVGFIPDVDVEKDESLQLPVPPFADAMYSAVRSLMSGGDREIMSDVVPLLVPGGISISRALGSAPKSETLQALGLQKRYAAWDQADAEGNVPVFDQDSRLLGMYSGPDIILRGLGTDLGRFQNQGEVTQFLLKNRDQMRDQRRQWIAAVLANNMAQAQKVKANYERQFGMPLTVTQQQMKEAMKIREESVASRTLGSMDKDLQRQYADVMQATVPQAMLSPQMPVEQGAMYVWSNLPKR